MEKINFTNLPDQTTPVNASNMNLMQNNIENAINTKNIITATISSNHTIQTSNTYEQLILNSKTSKGSSFTLTNDGAILIGSGISVIKLSANVSFNSVTAGLKWITIYKNDAVVAAAPCTLSARDCISISNLITTVSEGDKIYIKVQGTASDVVRGTIAYTNITIEAI